MDVIEGCKIKVSSSTIDTCLFQRSHLLLTFFLQVRILSKFRVFQILSRRFRGKNGNLESIFEKVIISLGVSTVNGMSLLSQSDKSLQPVYY